MEQKMESDTDYQGIDGEDIPALNPLHTAIRCGMRIDNSLSRQGTYRGTETVGHQQEHPLGTRTHLGVSSLVDEQVSR